MRIFWSLCTHALTCFNLRMEARPVKVVNLKLERREFRRITRNTGTETSKKKKGSFQNNFSPECAFDDRNIGLCMTCDMCFWCFTVIKNWPSATNQDLPVQVAFHLRLAPRQLTVFAGGAGRCPGRWGHQGLGRLRRLLFVGITKKFICFRNNSKEPATTLVSFTT